MLNRLRPETGGRPLRSRMFTLPGKVGRWSAKVQVIIKETTGLIMNALL